MYVELTGDAAVFARRVAGWLATEPFTANVLAVMLAGVLAGTRSTIPDPAWVTVTDGRGAVVGVAMHTAPLGVFLPRLPAGAAAAVGTAFPDAGRRVAGASGEQGSLAEFVAAWTAATGERAELSRATRMFRLDRLVPPTGVPGAVRAAGPAEADLVGNWFSAFGLATGGPTADPAALADTARRRTANGEVVLWESAGRARALASVSPPAAGVARIGPVFTPPEDRRHGFAAAVTAAAAARALAGGAGAVALYTALANATADGVYRRIGFVPEFDAGEVTFVLRRASGPG